MPIVPFYLEQLIDLTARGVVRWRRVGPDRYRLLVGGDAATEMGSRSGEGAPPYVLETDSREAPSVEVVGDTDDLAYNEAFNRLYAAVVASLADE
jgi:hypothetical protein